MFSHLFQRHRYSSMTSAKFQCWGIIPHLTKRTSKALPRCWKPPALPLSGRNFVLQQRHCRETGSVDSRPRCQLLFSILWESQILHFSWLEQRAEACQQLVRLYSLKWRVRENPEKIIFTGYLRRKNHNIPWNNVCLISDQENTNVRSGRRVLTVVQQCGPLP